MKLVALAGALVMAANAASAQTPQPFPRPAPPQQRTPREPAPQQPAPPAAAPAAETTPADPGAPTEATLGLPIFPTAQFIASYDAGRGQRYYIFGSTMSFAELVNYYRTVLKERGSLVFDEPPTHMFEVGRFRDDTMAFPPGVTVKDFTWGGSKGYPNPKRPPNPERFPTIIMLVPMPAATRGR